MFSSPIFWALLLLSFCFCSFTFVLGRRALCPVRQLFKNCHIYHLQHSQAVVGCAFLKLTRHLIIIIHRLVSFLLLLASSPDGFIFKHRQSTIGCVCTLARKVVLLIGSIITFFFFVALVHERVAGLEKCKHIDSIMHYFGWRYFCTHTECLNVHERSFTQ